MLLYCLLLLAFPCGFFPPSQAGHPRRGLVLPNWNVSVLAAGTKNVHAAAFLSQLAALLLHPGGCEGRVGLLRGGHLGAGTACEPHKRVGKDFCIPLRSLPSPYRRVRSCPKPHRSLALGDGDTFLGWARRDEVDGPPAAPGCDV